MLAKRFAALLFDGVMIFLLQTLIWFLISIAVPLPDPTTYGGVSSAWSDALNNYINLLSVVGVGVALAYFVVTTGTRNGQTPGKQLLQIRVARLDGTPLTLRDVLVRELIGRPLSTVLLVGYLWALFDPRHQTLHDKIAGTFVSDAPESD